MRQTSASQFVQVHIAGGMAFEDVNCSPLLLTTSRLGPQKESATRQLFVDLPGAAAADEAHEP